MNEQNIRYKREVTCW